jgi:hypothetical protein
VREHLVGIIHQQGADPRFHEHTADMFEATPMERIARSKWRGFARAVTHTMAVTRLGFHRQTCTDGFYAPMSWAAAKTGANVAAAVANGTSLALRMCVKTRKGRAEEIISKNMTTVGLDVLIHHVKVISFFPRPSAPLSKCSNGKPLRRSWPPRMPSPCFTS